MFFNQIFSPLRYALNSYTINTLMAVTLMAAVSYKEQSVGIMSLNYGLKSILSPTRFKINLMSSGAVHEVFHSRATQRLTDYPLCGLLNNTEFFSESTPYSA